MMDEIFKFFKQCREMGIHVELHFSSSDQSWSGVPDVPGTPPAPGKEKERPKEERPSQEQEPPRTRTRRSRGDAPEASSTEQKSKPKAETKGGDEEEVRKEVRVMMRKVIADEGNDEAFSLLEKVTQKKRLPDVGLEGLLKLKEYLETYTGGGADDEGGML